MNGRKTNRARIAERARARTSTRPVGPVSTDLRARVLTEVKPSGPGIRKRKASMTGAQRSAHENKRSLWTASPYLRDSVANDPKWSNTVRTVS